MEKQRRLRYATNLAHKPTEKKHKDDNMQTPAHTHTNTHCVSVAALIIYSRPTLLTLPGKQTTERRKQEGRKGEREDDNRGGEPESENEKSCRKRGLHLVGVFSSGIRHSDGGKSKKTPTLLVKS